MYFSITVCPSTWHFWRWLSSSCGILEFLGGCHVLFNYCSMWWCVLLSFLTANWNPIRPLEVTHCTLSSDIPRKRPRNNLGGGFKDFFTPIPSKMIQFDEHIFQMGWLNHQLAMIGRVIFFWHGQISNATIWPSESVIHRFQLFFRSHFPPENEVSQKRGSRWQVKTSVCLRWGLLSKCYWQRTEWSYHGDLDFIEQTNQPSLHRNGGNLQIS